MRSIYGGQYQGRLQTQQLQRQADMDAEARRAAEENRILQAQQAQNAMIVAQETKRVEDEERKRRNAIENERLALDRERVKNAQARTTQMDARTASMDERWKTSEDRKAAADEQTAKRDEQRFKMEQEGHTITKEKNAVEKAESDQKLARKKEADKYRTSARIARDLGNGEKSFDRMEKDNPGWIQTLGYKDIAEHADGTITLTEENGETNVVTRDQLTAMAAQHDDEALRIEDPVAYAKMVEARDSKAAAEEGTRARTTETRRKTALEIAQAKVSLATMEGEVRTAKQKLVDAQAGFVDNADGTRTQLDEPNPGAVQAARIAYNTRRNQLKEAKAGMSILEEQMPKEDTGGGAIKKAARARIISAKEQADLDRINERVPPQAAVPIPAVAPALGMAAPVQAQVQPPAQAPAPTQTMPGDINGDGTLSDDEKVNALDYMVKNGITMGGQPLTAAQIIKYKAALKVLSGKITKQGAL